MPRLVTRTVAALTAAVLAAALVPAAQASAAPAWGACPADSPTPAGALPLNRYQCATMDVPLSYRDPGGPQLRLAADLGSQQALHSFLNACAGTTRCAFNTPGAGLLDKYNGVLDRLAAGPLTITDPATGQSATVRYQDAIARTIESLTNADNSPELAEFLQRLGTATTSPAAPEAAAPKAATISTPFDSLVGGGATQCADALNPTDPAVWPRYAAATDHRARGFGPYFTYLSLPCVRFPSADADHYAGPWNRHTATPLLLLGNSQGDPDTPYPGAQRTAELLGNARLLTLDSFGHGSLNHSQCVDDAVDAYFLRLQVPAANTVCEPDHGPF